MNDDRPRRRPTHTVFVPDPLRLAELLGGLVAAGCTFTAEPSPTQVGVWHVGLFDDGLTVATDRFGPAKDIGTLGDYL